MKRSPVPLAPFSLCALVIALDQMTKALVAARVPFGTIAWSAFGDFLWIIQVRNKAWAFSLGAGIEPGLRGLIFTALPIIFIGLLCLYYFRGKEIGKLQRWALCGIMGGGAGNLIDRIARPLGVVDFVSVKFYGILGMERWPTFNVADASVVVCSILLVIALIGEERRRNE